MEKVDFRVSCPFVAGVNSVIFMNRLIITIENS